MDIFSTPSPNSYFYTHYLMRGGGALKFVFWREDNINFGILSTLACEVNFYLTKVRSFVSNRVKQLIDFLPHFFDTQSLSLNDVSSCFFVKLNNHNLDT